MKSDQTNFSKRNFLIQLYGVSLLVIIIYLVLYFLFHPSQMKFMLLMALGFAFLIGMLLTLRTNQLTLSAHFFLGFCFLFLFSNAMFTAGIDTPGITWLLLCPLIAFITLSTRWARI